MVEDRERVREMLADLEGYLDGLREKQGVSKDRYVNDVDLQDTLSVVWKKRPKRVLISDG